jgi:hypothetical protein
VSGFFRGFEEGRYFRVAFSLILRALAVLVALAGIVYWIGIWFSVIRRATVGLVVGWFLAELPYAIALFAVVWILWQRGGEIRRLPGGVFPSFDITALIVRLFGEISAVLLSLGGIAGMILIWAAGQQLLEPLRLFVRLSGRYALYVPSNRFLVGLGYGVAGVVEAIVVLLLAYFVSEAILLLRGIMVNTQAIRHRLESSSPSAQVTGQQGDASEVEDES